MGSTYKADVQTICNAEQGSGLTVERSASKVSQWIRARLATRYDGNRLFSALTDDKLPDRAKHLQNEATAQNAGACPMTQAYIERVAAQEGSTVPTSNASVRA